MWAMVTQASAPAMDFSGSFDRRGLHGVAVDLIEQAVGAIRRIASNTSRKCVGRGLPVALGGGKKGAINARFAPVRSLAYPPPARAC
jgi:hypothetical protein